MGQSFARWLRLLSLTYTGLAGLILAVVGWWAARQLGARTMYLMVYASVGAVVLSYIVSRRRLLLVAQRSNLPARVLVGQNVDVDLDLESRRRVSTILLEEGIPERLGQSITVPVASLGAGQQLSYRYSFVPSMRGVYQVGPLVAMWSDPFGFTTHRQLLLPASEIIVHPRTEKVHDGVLTRMWEDPPVRPPISKPWPVGFEFYGLRDYVPGDDLRRVVWSAVAKTGKMLVRESEQGITDRVCIYLDDNRDAHSPGEPSDTFETAVRIAASVGERHLHDGFSVTLLTNQGRLQSGLRGPRARLRLMDELARLNVGRKTLDDAGQVLMEEARAGAHLLVITPFLDERGASRLRLAVQRGASLSLALVSWDESDPLSVGRAAAIGAQVIPVPSGAPLDSVFSHPGGRRR